MCIYIYILIYNNNIELYKTMTAIAIYYMAFRRYSLAKWIEDKQCMRASKANTYYIKWPKMKCDNAMCGRMGSLGVKYLSSFPFAFVDACFRSVVIWRRWSRIYIIICFLSARKMNIDDTIYTCILDNKRRSIERVVHRLSQCLPLVPIAQSIAVGVCERVPQNIFSIWGNVHLTSVSSSARTNTVWQFDIGRIRSRSVYFHSMQQSAMSILCSMHTSVRPIK